MSDEQQAPEEGTPAPASPPEGTAPGSDGEDAVDYQKRYEDMRSEFDRRGTRLTELEQAANEYTRLTSDPNAYVEFGSQQGWVSLPDDGETDTEFADPQEKLAQRLEALEATVQQQTQTAQQQKDYAAYREQYDPEISQKVPETLTDLVAHIAFYELPAIPTPRGPVPDVDGAVNQINEMAAMFAEHPEVQKRVKQSWAQTKRTHQVSPNGGEGTQTYDITTHEGRVARAMARLEADQE